MILLDIEQRRFIKKGTNFLNTGWQLSKKKSLHLAVGSEANGVIF